MLRETASATPESLEIGRRTDIGATLAVLSLGAVALASAVFDPLGNSWPAAALIAALGLEHLGRIATRIALRGRTGPYVVAIPSMILASDRGTIAAALLFAAAALIRPDLFSVFAALLAGLMAMGGIARLVIAWTVFRAGRETEEE